MNKLYFCVCLLVVMISSKLNAQTLSPGDIVIIGLASDTGTATTAYSEFSWLPLVDLTAGTKIYFTDAGYNAASSNWMGTGLNDEILLRYIVPTGGIAKGTVLTVTEAANPANYTVITGTKFGNDFNQLLTLPNAGDQITVFQSTDNELAPATFGNTNFTAIYMATTSSLSFTALTSTTAGVTPTFNLDNVTNLAPGLTVGVNAVAVGTGPLEADESDNARYTGTTSGTREQILAAVSLLSNWTRHDTAFANDLAFGSTPNGWTANGATQFTISTPAPTAEIQDVRKSAYTRIPVKFYGLLSFGAKIKNTGAAAFTAKLKVIVKDAGAATVTTSTSSAVTVNGGAVSTDIIVPGLTTALPTGTYTISYEVIVDTDTVIATANTVDTLLFTADEMARDDGTTTATLGIGTGNGGYMGQTYEIGAATSLTSIDITTSLNNNSMDISIGAAVFKIVGGVPQLLYTAPSQVLPDGAPAQMLTYAVSPPLEFEPGDIVLVCAKENSGTMTLAQTTTKFTPGTVFVYWDGTPFGGWANIEQFGISSFNKSFMIRPRLQCVLADPVVTTPQAFCAGATVAQLTATGDNIAWYTDPSGGVALTAATVLTAGTYYVSQSLGDCSSMRVAVEVTVTANTSNSTTVSACDTYTWSVNGQTYIDSGTYTNVVGCHTETLVLTITDSTSNSTTASACDTYTWSVNGQTYTDSGTYTNVVGCHTETLVLTITDSTSNSTTASACDTYTWSVNGQTYTDSGTYTNVTGCHTETLVLTITDSTSNSTTASACDTYTWSVNGQTYIDSGTYTNVVGCHTETLVLTITDSTSNSTTASACDTYTWSVNGQTYTDSGTYTNVVGCHTETLVLTITDSTSNSTTASACDTYTWSVNGQTYTDSGTYTNVVGCHTETLVLTITDSTSNSTTASACDTYTWSVNGQTYIDSGTYTNVVGCHTETLVLTITDSTSNSTTASACDTYTWSVNGQTYTDSGTYTNVVGCHTETLVLTITDSTSNTLSVTACDSYTWPVNGQTYTLSGTFTNTVGCHTETIILTIVQSPTITSQPEDESLTEGASAVFTFSGTNLGFIQWQWNNAGTWTNIPEGSGYTGTNTTTLTIDGTVVSTALNGLSVRAIIITSLPCPDVFTDTAILTVTLGTDKNDIRSLKLYPNPATAVVFIEYADGGSASITVSDINGRLMRSQTIQQSGSAIDISTLESGVYLFRITTATGTANRKMIKN